MLKEQRPITTNKTEKRLMEDYTVTLNGVDFHYRTIGDGQVLFLVPPGWGVRLHYPLDVMLTGIRWFVAYPLSAYSKCSAPFTLVSVRGMRHSTIHGLLGDCR
jgi:hypothetical protein